MFHTQYVSVSDTNIETFVSLLNATSIEHPEWTLISIVAVGTKMVAIYSFSSAV